MPISIPWRTPSRRWIFVVSPILLILVLFHLSSLNLGQYVPFHIKEDVSSAIPSVPETPSEPEVPSAPETNTDGDPYNCHLVRGIENVLVVLKTGVTEALEKVPVHMNTTLTCIPHYVIFSDYEEDIAGIRTVDVLRSLNPELKQTNSDFGLYNRVHELGRDGLLDADWYQDVNSPFGKPGNPGWVLDKWKFLPMVTEALQAKPDANWYVFVEADTYVIWPNLMAWLDRFDAAKPWYLGFQMGIGNITFAYGGAGIVISNSAARMLSEYRASRLQEMDDFTISQWAGDCVLGKVLRDAGVQLTWAWPMLQGGHLEDTDPFEEGYGRHPWCMPVVTYHHMAPNDIEAMWTFEQQWWSDHHQHSLLLHSDVFQNFIYATPFTSRDDWDNLAPDEVQANKDEGSSAATTLSPGECATICDKNPECLQYRFKNGVCSTAKGFKMGHSELDVHSGWVPDRINATIQRLGKCTSVEYIQG